MTVIDRWTDREGTRERFQVNGCFDAEIWEHEVYGPSVDVPATRVYVALVWRRLTPLVWLAMPGHEGPRPLAASGDLLKYLELFADAAGIPKDPS